MVALCVRTIECRPVTCLARPLLFRAFDDLQAGKFIEAGCRLREAVRLYMLAECEWHDCLPSKKAQRSASLLLKAFLKKNPDYGAQWLWEILDYGNKLAHCGYVRPGTIKTCIEIMHCYLDQSPYLVQQSFARREGGAE